MRRDLVLRGAALVMLAGAVVDPGCERRRPARVTLVVGPDVSPVERAEVVRAVEDAGLTTTDIADGPGAVRISIGSPSDLLELHEIRPLAIAIRPALLAPHVADMVVPRVMVAGLSASLRVRLGEGTATTAEALRVDVRDLATGQRVGLARVPAPVQGDPVQGDGRWVDVPLVPTREGRWTLCVEARREVAGGAPGRCEVVDVQVYPAAIRVDVLEARPSWAARFARLALERWGGAMVTSSVRVAPQIDVAARSGESPSAGGADILLVGGLEGLSGPDVVRLTVAARDEGRTVVLLADGPVDGARLRALWPDALGTIATSPTPARIAVGTHGWRAREWLRPRLASTDVEALAYLDATPPVPVVLARPVGAGRVVMVTALDAWRWRLADRVAFDEGWQALVLSLVADAADAARPAVWRVSGPLTDEMHVAVSARAPTRAPGVATSAPIVRREGATAAAASFAVADSGERRATLRVAASTASVRLVMEGAGVGQDAPAVIEVGSAATVPTTWTDLERRLAGDGGQVVDVENLAAAVRAVAAPRLVDGPRWFVSRQWWFAALVIGALGIEWWWRRLARQR